MKITIELFGAAREFSNKDFIELNLLQPSSIKDLKNELVKMIDDKFNGNQNFKKIVMSSAFCSENDNIVSDNFKICLLYTSPSPRDLSTSRMPSSA